ncbi:MAG: hypothetical protein LAE24_07925 [Candidatus Contendobacter sp.]|nr:hypothetical protein [Candidatus Contendobacter sp.]
MAITLDSFTLPAGLCWSDEFAWSPLGQSSEYSLTGALLVQQSVKLAGRPITLTGTSSGTSHTAWLTRAQVLTLQAKLDTNADMTLTLHDSRTFTVRPAPDSANALQSRALPIAYNAPPADPDNGHWYIIESLKLIEV